MLRQESLEIKSEIPDSRKKFRTQRLKFCIFPLKIAHTTIKNPKERSDIH